MTDFLTKNCLIVLRFTKILHLIS